MAVMTMSSAAYADDVRGQGFLVGMYGGAGVAHPGSTQPAVAYALGLGFAVDPAATIAIGVELDGVSSWTSVARHDRGGILGTVTLWFTDRVSAELGAGTPVVPETSGDAFQGFGRVRYEMRRWQRSALVVALDGTAITGSGPQVSALVGFELFTHKNTMNLWTPPTTPHGL
jgi:hypothetical protein